MTHIIFSHQSYSCSWSLFDDQGDTTALPWSWSQLNPRNWTGVVEDIFWYSLKVFWCLDDFAILQPTTAVRSALRVLRYKTVATCTQHLFGANDASDHWERPNEQSFILSTKKQKKSNQPQKYVKICKNPPNKYHVFTLGGPGWSSPAHWLWPSWWASCRWGQVAVCVKRLGTNVGCEKINFGETLVNCSVQIVYYCWFNSKWSRIDVDQFW